MGDRENVEYLKQMIALLETDIKFLEECVKKGNAFIQFEAKKDLPGLRKKLKRYQKLLKEKERE